MGTVNKKCQVSTPQEIVIQILDEVGYVTDLYGKRVLENSCGEGNFLAEIVERYIKDCIDRKFSTADIVFGLQRDIHGFEKDRQAHRKCIHKLNEITTKYGLNNIHWNIKRRNALMAAKSGKYQFVIGNPPYLAYPELDSSTRKYLRGHFVSCSKGKPDYYYAFMESALNSLADDGKMAYLVPGNFMKNLYGENLRQYLLPYLYKIVNYSHRRLFVGVLTSSVIIYCDRTRRTEDVQYEDRHYDRISRMPKDRMRGKWIFTDEQQEKCVRFGDYFHAGAPVATQLNEAFVVRNWIGEDEDYVYFENSAIEKAVLRDAVSPKALQQNVQEKIIFPYYYNEQGALMHFSRDDFQIRFPGAMEHLEQYHGQLLERKTDKHAKWFEFGRSQLLMHLNQEKLVMSTFVSVRPRVYELDVESVPYAGICIIARPGYTITQARRVLESELFLDYVHSVGVCTSGNSYRISPTDINSFCFPRMMMEG